MKLFLVRPLTSEMFGVGFTGGVLGQLNETSENHDFSGAVDASVNRTAFMRTDPNSMSASACSRERTTQIHLAELGL
jgi:hypothetical protein